jgi:hypothetical protein
MQLPSLTAASLFDLVLLLDRLPVDVNIVFAPFKRRILVVVRSVHVSIRPI